MVKYNVGNRVSRKEGNQSDGFVFHVTDQDEFFKAQCSVSGHLPLVYGDYSKELVLSVKALDLRFLTFSCKELGLGGFFNSSWKSFG